MGEGLPSTIIDGLNSLDSLCSIGIELSQRSTPSNKDIIIKLGKYFYERPIDATLDSSTFLTVQSLNRNIIDFLGLDMEKC